MNLNETILFLADHRYIGYLLVAIGSYFETLIVTSVFVYGEIIFLAGSIAASQGILNVWLVYLAAVIGGILGDHTSYFLGYRYGERFIKRFFTKESKYLNLENLDKSESFFKKHGPKSVFFARLLGPISWITPFIAGVFKVKYSRFTKYNFLGVLFGVGQFIALGYLLGFAYVRLFPLLEEYFTIFLIVFLFLAYVLYKLSSRYEIASKIKNFIFSLFEKYGVFVAMVYVIINVLVIYLVSKFI